MLKLSGIYLLLVLGDGSEMGMKEMPNLTVCEATAQSYRSKPRFTTVACVENPVVGSQTVADRGINQQEVFNFLNGVLRQLGQLGDR